MDSKTQLYPGEISLHPCAATRDSIMATPPTTRPELFAASLPMSLLPSKQTATADQAPTAAIVVRQIETMTGQPKGTNSQ